ncbi:hypothetical protein SDJN02_07844, partial [Cucurbita argyrosperma subsp. argyrosperma]
MLFPNPLSFIIVLLCLPLAILFTINSLTTIDSGDPSEHPFVLPLQSPKLPPEDDDFLFPLAAGVNATPSPTHKLAFMFLTNSPLPFAPLWELFFENVPPDLFNVYIHADPAGEYDPPFSGVFAHRVIPSKPTKRFSPSLAAAARRLLAHALLHDSANSMFALLSPSCIPLHSFNFTYRTLIRSKKSFIEILRNEIGAFDRWAVRGPDVMLPVVKLADFRIGSQFWVLTRRHARLVVRDQRVWSKFKLPCVRWYICYPEENYFPTLLNMWDRRGVVPATLTHVDWNGSSDGHPRTYEASEVGQDLIRELRMARPRYGDGGMRIRMKSRQRGGGGRNWPVGKSRGEHPFLFARKFSAESLQPLMNISMDFILRD